MNQHFHVTSHAVDQYLARIDPSITWERARRLLERRVKHAKRFPGSNRRQRRKAHQDSCRYYTHHELVFVVDLDTKSVVTILRRAWLHRSEPPTDTQAVVDSDPHVPARRPVTTHRPAHLTRVPAAVSKPAPISPLAAFEQSRPPITGRAHHHRTGRDAILAR